MEATAVSFSVVCAPKASYSVVTVNILLRGIAMVESESERQKTSAMAAVGQSQGNA